MFTLRVDNDIELKMPTIQDAEELFKLTDISRIHLRKWLPWVDQTKEVTHTKLFIEHSLELYSQQKGLNTLILYKGKIAGVAGFNSLDHVNKVAQIGYWLGVHFEGLGIMTKVARTLTKVAYTEYNMNKVEIRAAVGNIKSRNIPKRLEYTEEGIIREAEWLYDHYVDHVVYGMLKREWEA